MNKKNTVDVVCIVDKSGSMINLVEDTIGGFNNFLKEQQAVPGKAKLTLALFSDTYDPVYDRVPIKEAKELTKETYKPFGFTALLYAITETINSVKSKQKKRTPTIVTIITDGLENYSPNFGEEYSREQTKKLIERMQEDHGWQFHFLGANIDAFKEAGSLGISSAFTNQYTPDSAGVRNAYGQTVSSTTKFREEND